MGDISSMGGSIYNMVKGPPDPGVQPTSPATGGNYSPTAYSLGGSQEDLARQSAASRGLMASGVGSDVPITMPTPSAKPGSIQPIGSDFGIRQVPSPASMTTGGTGSISAPGGIFSNVAPKGGVSTEGTPDTEKFNVPAMVGLANNIAQTGRGFMNDFSKGPGGSPLAPRAAAGGMPYQPTARNRPMTLRDLLARR